MTAPLFSVIVPTRDRHDALATCLDRIAPGAQTIAADQYEVIVADDSGTGSARALIAARFPWARWVAGPRCGPAANRNAGAREAHGDVLVFTDDDCVPEPDWLGGYAAALEAGIDVYEGRTTCVAGVRSPRETSPSNAKGGALWSCNFAMRRGAFERLGGFDERFPFPHMEDADLRERIRSAAVRMRFVPEATVDHPPRRLAWGARRAASMQADVLYMVLHPPVRPLPVFLAGWLRSRLSRVRRLPLSLDSLSDLVSLVVELATIVRRWRGWLVWARYVTSPSYAGPTPGRGRAS